MITERQRQLRGTGIGSSDAAAIFGFNPYRSAADVRLEKLGMVPVEDEPPSEAAEIGNAIESGIASIAGKRLGAALVRPSSTFVHPDHDCLRANVDFQVGRWGRGVPPVECKSSRLDLEWLAPDDSRPHDQLIPPMVLIQVCHQLLCCGATEAHVARLSTGFRPAVHLYRIAATDDVARLMDAMLAKLPVWWQKHVVNADPLPEGSPPPSLDILRRIRREPATEVEVPDELFIAAARARDERLKAEAVEEAAEARLIDAMGTAEGARCGAGTCTFFEQTSRRIDLSALRDEQPVIAEQYTKPSTTRVLRLKPAK